MKTWTAIWAIVNIITMPIAIGNFTGYFGNEMREFRAFAIIIANITNVAWIIAIFAKNNAHHMPEWAKKEMEKEINREEAIEKFNRLASGKETKK
jgi:hypothetical protein